MTRYVRRRSSKLGLAPGTLVYTGEHKVERARVTLISYDGQFIEEREVDDLSTLASLIGRPGTHWLNLDGVHETASVEAAGALVGAPALVLEDIVTPGQRAKVHELDRSTFIVTRMLSYDAASRRIQSEQVSFLLAPGLLVSFQEREGDVFGHVRDRLRAGKGQIRGRGADYLAYALLDVLVDHYFVVLEHLGDELDALEDDVIDRPDPSVQHRLRALRGNLVLIRRASWPVRELLATLSRGDSPRIGADVRVYLQDAHEHAVQVVDVIESLREVGFGLNDLYMGALSQRMNDVMKVLTIIGTLFIPLSFIAGLYGMNFDRMPELHWTYGYGFALGLMALVAGGLLTYFRRRGWI